MKRIALLLFATLLFCGCRYEESSWSIYSPDERIVGDWRLMVVEKNGQVSVDSIAPLGNKHWNYHFFYIDQQFSVTTTQNSALISSVRGDWSLGNKYRDLTVFYVLDNQRFSYTAQIVKLSNKELKYRYTDANGDKWYLELYKQLGY